MDNKYKKLAKNSFWTLAGNAGSKMLGFLLLPLYTHWLGTAGFGETDLVTTYSSFLVSIMTLCVSDAIFVFTKNRENNVKKTFFSTSIAFIIAILCIWGGLWYLLDIIFTTYSINNSFSNNLWYIYGIVVSTFWQTYSQQFILSLEKIKIYSLSGTILTILTFIFSYLLIPTMGVRGYIFSMIMANLITGCYSFIFTKSYRYFSQQKIEWKKMNDVLKYSLPLIPNAIMWWLVGALNRPIMEYNLSYSEIGIFAVANRFPSVITMIFTVFSTAWTISVFEEYGKKDFEDFYKKTFRMTFFFITLVACVVIFFSKDIIMIFATPDFFDAWKFMIILIISAAFSCISSFLGTCFNVTKKSNYFFYSSVWGAGTAIILNFILIPLWGLWGTSLSVLLSFAVIMISRYKYSLKYIPISLTYYIFKYAIVLIIMSIGIYFIDSNGIKIAFVSFLLIVFVFSERQIFTPMIVTIKSKRKL